MGLWRLGGIFKNSFTKKYFDLENTLEICT
jgi:hypothetical protein